MNTSADVDVAALETVSKCLLQRLEPDGPDRSHHLGELVHHRDLFRRRAAALVQQFCSGWTVERLRRGRADDVGRRTSLAIFAEALDRLSKADLETTAEITDLARISFRNILVQD